MKPLSWKPVRRGQIYCAPACGRGCSHNEYLDAHKHAAALAKRLGRRWTPFVHENLGWHFKVISPCKQIEVHVNGPRSYWANLRIAGMQFEVTRESPLTAVHDACDMARRHLRELELGCSQIPLP